MDQLGSIDSRERASVATSAFPALARRDDLSAVSSGSKGAAAILTAESNAPAAATDEVRRVRLDLTGLEIWLQIPPPPATEVTAIFTQVGDLPLVGAGISRKVVQVPVDQRFIEDLRDRPSAFHVCPGAMTEVRKLCAALLGTTGLSPKIARLFERSLAAAILARLADAGRPETDPGSKPSVVALPKWRLRQVTTYIDEHMTEQIRLADLSQAAGLTRMYFAAQFRIALGMSPHDYLQRRRIARAQILLRDPNQTLVDVALTVGFQSQAHFTTVFGRLTGETPHRWRCAHPASNQDETAANT